MKKILLLICLVLVILCTGCQKEEEPLGTLKETVTSVVDPTASINVEDFITVEDATEVSYVIDPEDEKIIFTLTKDNRTETIEVEVTFVEEEKPVEDIDDEEEPAITEDVSAEEVPEETAAETETAEPEVQTWVYDCEYQALAHPELNQTDNVYTLNSDGTGHLTTPYWDGDISWNGDIVDDYPLTSGHVGDDEFIRASDNYQDGTGSQYACKLRK